ncbi:facilitated trehalose transporter Tret1-like isoform X2 [Macrosteles quadrilineatus]|uniref:facilitated trehalose transporter Tret1-like isoform X2 n=1 Tax=Macrosteles quadrilineatus TaxID=74068 RepID=UPI0023E19F3F|nr:facilitated trehalose transporter Tret1-like isoform X2 [Macrosteles quadrilineatus]
MQKEKKLHRQWIAAIIATIGLFMMGMNLGWPSPTLQLMRKPDAEVHLTEDQISWMVSVLYIGSTLSPVPTGWLMNCLGRRLTLMILTSVALASWIILATVKSPMGVYIARFLGGMWGGSAYTVAPIYLCEIAEPEVRGALNTLFILMAYVGIMFEYCIGPRVSYTELSMISACIPVTFVMLLLWVPESPYFYLMKGNRKKAGKALAWLRCAESPSEVENDLSVIEKAVIADMQNKGRLKDLVSTAGNRKALLIAEMLAVLQRMSGISVVMAYASAAIPQTGGFTSNDCAVILCFIWIVFGLFSTVLVNWAGRRTLLAVSCLGCALGNAMIAGWFFLDTNTTFDAMSIAWFQMLSFSVYGAFFPIGLGCVPNMIQGEMFPANTRGLASGVTSAIISLTSFITNKMYFNLGESVGLYVNYAIFCVSCLYGVYFSLAVVIETKDRSLEDIQVGLSELTMRKNEKKTKNTR